jgi:succinate dehydrogenase / fumarate reductase cytochrome b subunit
MHRITGVALYAGTLLLAAWLLSAAMGQVHYDCFMEFMSSWFGRLILFGFTWALVFHALGGIRHLVQDTGRGLEKDFTTNLAYMIFILSVLITVMLWVLGYNSL